jgi:hypothetical protein
MFITMKNLTRIVSTIGLLTVGNLIFTDAANAFSVTFSGTENLGFENQYNGWTTIGDTTVQSTFQTIAPQGGSYQALITNACHDCVDNGSIRNDDSHVSATASTFNYSNTNPVTASVEQTNNLQSQLGISNNALSINAKLNGSEISGVYRTPKEGSAILSDTFTVTDGSFTLSFNWNYLTNDGASNELGDQDFSFVTIYSVDGSGEPVTYYTNNDSYSQIDVLADSTGTIPTVNDSNFATVSGYNTYTSGVLPAGSYRVGYGVVDVDGVDRSSGLLVDNILVQEIPFEFSPGLGLGIVAVMFGCDRLRRNRIRSKTVDNFSERSPINH